MIMPDNANRQLAVRPYEIITEIDIPALPENTKGTYKKNNGRKVWAFATAALALRLNIAGRFEQNVRVVLGGVASVLLRAFDSEMTLWGSNLNDSTIKQTAGAAITGGTAPA
jgi:CO/xanthine dehydrogenase FAD-binding subunit